MLDALRHTLSMDPMSRRFRARRKILVAAATAGLLTCACRMDPTPDAAAHSTSSGMPAQVEIGEVLWFVDYEAAVEVARREGKPLWVHFGENPG